MDVPLEGIARLLVETPVDALDLHGLSARQARERVERFLRSRARAHPGRVVHVVTGKGNRSEGAPVLLPMVASLLAEDAAEHVEESAGLRGGGGFAVRLRS